MATAQRPASNSRPVSATEVELLSETAGVHLQQNKLRGWGEDSSISEQCTSLLIHHPFYWLPAAASPCGGSLRKIGSNSQVGVGGWQLTAFLQGQLIQPGTFSFTSLGKAWAERTFQTVRSGSFFVYYYIYYILNIY